MKYFNLEVRAVDVNSGAELWKLVDPSHGLQEDYPGDSMLGLRACLIAIRLLWMYAKSLVDELPAMELK